jgi:cyclase
LKKLEEIGISHFIITDVSRDGAASGPNFNLYKELSILKKEQTEIIASGGIRTCEDIEKVLTYSNGIIIGKALYSNKISRMELSSLNIKYNPTNLIKRIIPCLDVKDGRVVKGINFKDLRDSGDPVELAKFYDNEGADELVFLDISATLEERQTMLKTLSSIAETINIPFSVGGGIKSLDEMIQIIKAGAEKVSINTAAVNNPSIINKGAQKLGSQSIIVAIDAKRTDTNWEVYIKSGTEPTGLDVLDWTKEVVKRGAGEILLTSIDKDGTKTGYDLDLIKILSKEINVPIIASGGAGDYFHFFQAINAGAEAVLAASLFHDRIMSIKDLKEYLKKRDIKVRI